MHIVTHSLTMAGSSYWRLAGLSYLQYLNKASGAVRSCLKEPMLTQSAVRDRVAYISRDWANGVRGDAGKFSLFGNTPGFLMPDCYSSILFTVEIKSIADAFAKVAK